MEQLSINMFWVGVVALGVAVSGYLAHTLGAWVVLRPAATDAGSITVATVARLPASVGRFSTLATWLALASLTTSLAVRWAGTGRPPYTNMWEFAVAFAWGIVLTYAIFERWYGQRTLGAFMLSVALGLCLAAWAFFPAQVQPLVPALQANDILGFHVGTMVLAYGALSVSFGAAVMYLIQGERRRFARLPRGQLLEEVAHRSVLLGFPLLTLGVALGAYWGNSAWGRYWGWDPKETASLVTWLVYAGYMHMRGLRGWRGQRATLLLVAGFMAILFTFFAVNLWVSGLHSYAGV
ncbi:MAG: c-type cytochrome biogenesis protein CcsB [Dehalococcoidia bacterium]